MKHVDPLFEAAFQAAAAASGLSASEEEQARTLLRQAATKEDTVREAVRLAVESLNLTGGIGVKGAEKLIRHHTGGAVLPRPYRVGERDAVEFFVPNKEKP